MNKSKIKVVCDAGPIIHLDEIDCIDLLNDFKEIIIPNTVCTEINRYRPFQANQRLQGLSKESYLILDM